ncbi:MAG TPA: tryptophan 7-halogenase [Bryobacteraceae bacterium]|nr:tryptophan 7-halogenase [Bryobacteraceae bacterium]
MREVEVLIIGAGPAGATAALNLARLRHTALIDASAAPHERIGESLAPAARRLLTDMRLFDEFLAEQHVPCYGNRSVWGSVQPADHDFLRGPDGPGWHLDRARFESWLRRAADERGAALLIPARLEGVERVAGRWQVATSAGVISAWCLIDAGGRAAPLARRLGATRHDEDRLVCVWCYGAASPAGCGAGFTFVEAVQDGWWYTAPLPGGRRVLAFHTDSDLPILRSIRTPEALLAHTTQTVELHAILRDCAFRTGEVFGCCPAQGSALEPAAGAGWFAAGDASISFDPISAQGLFHALYTGLAAAEAADRWLAGDSAAPAGYIDSIREIHRGYRRHLEDCYRAEDRWSDSLFWARRRFSQGEAPPERTHGKEQ